MDKVGKLADALLTHNFQIDVLVTQIETKFPGKTLAELLVEGMFS
jgi:hypothetical protein